MSDSCTRCEEVIHDEVVQCYGGCNGKYHVQCTTMAIKTYRAKSEAKKKEWKCTNCRNPSTRNQATSASEDPTEDEIERKEERRSPRKRSLEEKIDRLLFENTKLNNAVQDLIMMVNEMRAELSKKDKEIQQLKDEIHEFEQHSRCEYLEIHNVPGDNLENQDKLEEMTVRVVKSLGIELERQEIEAIHRIPTKNTTKPNPIIVHLASRKKRNTILAAKRGKTIYQNSITGNRNHKEKVYINESLSKYHKTLLYKTKQAAKEYKYVWTKDGKILVRKDDNAKVKRIRNENDIETL